MGLQRKAASKSVWPTSLLDVDVLYSSNIAVADGAILPFWRI
ncbi:hypothetical protein [Allomuricauda sp. CP2A]|nr:hypothetical protein [Muricauda sp. CP2A]